MNRALVFSALALAALVVASGPRAEEEAAGEQTNPLAPVAGAENVHFPYDGEDCSSCHEGDAPDPGPVQEGGDDLCFLCHGEVESVIDEAKVKHNENGACIDCHNPHSSNHRALLLDEPRALCTSCHTDALPAKKAGGSEHGPMNSPEACTACHAAHGSEHAALTIAGDRALCMLCHMQPQRADDGRMLAATTEQLENAKVVHAPVEERCSSCHSAHGSAQQKLLSAPYPEGFYAPFSEETYGLCFSCHDAKLVTERTTTTATGFRDGDKNLHTLHVDRSDRGRSCRACHGAHVAEHPELVHQDVAYGSHGWRLELNFVKTAEGGNCTKTCHLVRKYTR